MSIPVTSAARVFVVDDDEAVRDSIKTLLEVHGFEVEDFASTVEFAKNYRKPPRGCLIIDQHLPVTTGLDFLRSAAARELDIPVILITGRGDPIIEQRGYDAGVAQISAEADHAKTPAQYRRAGASSAYQQLPIAALNGRQAGDEVVPRNPRVLLVSSRSLPPDRQSLFSPSAITQARLTEGYDVGDQVVDFGPRQRQIRHLPMRMCEEGAQLFGGEVAGSHTEAGRPLRQCRRGATAVDHVTVRAPLAR
jgi:two-component system response regulator FixJ